MVERKPLLLRLSPELVEELARWARDDLRSLNAQVEWILREAVRKRRRRLRDVQPPPEEPGAGGG